MPEDDPVPVVGLEALDEPADHYLLTINGSVVSGKVTLTPRDFHVLAEYVDDLREPGERIPVLMLSLARYPY